MFAVKFSGRGVVHGTVSEVKHDKHVRQLQQVVDQLQHRFDTELPKEAEVVFHNSERSAFDFGGWAPPNLPTKTDQASLFYSQGPIYYDGEDYKVRIDLQPRKMGRAMGLGQESLQAFAERALAEAKRRVDDAKFFRNYRSDGRCKLIALKLANRLKSNGFPNVEGGVTTNSPYYPHIKDYNGVLLMVDPAEIPKAKAALEELGCKEDTANPAKGDNRANLLYDDISVRLYPKTERHLSVRSLSFYSYTTPQVYKVSD